MKKVLSFVVVAVIVCAAAVYRLSNAGLINIGGTSGGGAGGAQIEGMWFGNSGGTAIGWLFQGNMYQLWEGASIKQSGNFTLNGNALALTINETGGAENLTVQFGAGGATMSMTDASGVTIAFQKGQGNQPVVTQPPIPTQPAPPAAPPTAPPSTPPAAPPTQSANIEGRWSVSEDSATYTWVFFGGNYQYLLNGRQEGYGPYSVQGDKLYITPAGKPQVVVTYKISPDGKTLLVDDGDGTVLMFNREQ